jgi:hypothetical protein
MNWTGSRLVTTRIALCSLSLVVITASTLAQTTIHVPAAQPTIQAGIDAAQDGDTVLVAPGLYVETIDFLGKAIVVESERGADATTIDGNGMGSVVTMASGESEGTVLRGFTITGGTGTLYGFSNPKVVGGGVFTANTVGPGPLIADCVIADNETSDGGGGVYAGDDTQIEGCLISDNRSADGGGFFLEVFAQQSVRDCRFARNFATGNGGGANASGTFERCLFVDNLAAGDGGGLYVGSNAQVSGCRFVGNIAAGDGGGMYIKSFLDIDQPTDFVGNRAGGSGGGIWAWRHEIAVGSSKTFVATGLRVEGNTANLDGGGLYLIVTNNTGWTFPYPKAVIELHLVGVTIVGNTAGRDGGAVYADFSNVPDPWDCQMGTCGENRLKIFNGTIADNAALAGGSMRIYTTHGAQLDDSIVWGNSTPLFNVDVPTAQYSIVEGGIPGTAILDTDPFFIDPPAGDYGLRGGSPAIDSGDPTAPVDADGSPADRGATPFAPWVLDGPGVGGAFGVPSLTATGLNSPDAATQILVRGAPPDSRGVLVVGNGKIAVPFKGGVFVPEPDFLVWPLATDAAGNWSLSDHWVPTLPSDYQTWQQVWFQDETAPAGWSATNGLKATTR